MYSDHSRKGFWLAAITVLSLLFSMSCSFLSRMVDQTQKEWSLGPEGLKTLVDDTNQGVSEEYRLLQSIDRVEFPKSVGMKVYGPCPFANAPTPEGDYLIAFITQDSRISMEISVRNTCGIQQNDPRVAAMNEQLTNALWEKITADCGKVLVNRLELSANGLTVFYVKSL